MNWVIVCGKVCSECWFHVDSMHCVVLELHVWPLPMCVCYYGCVLCKDCLGIVICVHTLVKIPAIATTVPSPGVVFGCVLIC